MSIIFSFGLGLLSLFIRGWNREADFSGRHVHKCQFTRNMTLRSDQINVSIQVQFGEPVSYLGCLKRLVWEITYRRIGGLNVVLPLTRLLQHKWSSQNLHCKSSLNKMQTAQCLRSIPSPFLLIWKLNLVSPKIFRNALRIFELFTAWVLRNHPYSCQKRMFRFRENFYVS